ncbi:MAG: Holliday junction branch migration DNA helicase RuvB [Patescibacteria group bacterium]
MLISSNSTTKTKSDDQSTNTKASKSKLDPELEILMDEETQTKNLRPASLSDLIGQKQVTKQLKIILDSARIRDKLPEHILFYGPPGLGKTTLASLIAAELGVNFKAVSAPAIQKSGDMVSLLLNLEPNTILFIDEIHRLKAPIEEILYTAMEDHIVDVVIGKGQGAITTRMDIAEFTLVGATTKLGKLSKPLQDRFTTIFQLQLYDELDIQHIIERNIDILGLNLEYPAIVHLSHYCRGTPRVANNILRRMRDFQVVHKLDTISKIDVEGFLHDLGIFKYGLTKQDIHYLEALNKAGSLGVKTLAGILLEEVDTIEEVREPYLIHLGLVDKGVEGRRLTPEGKNYINYVA